MSVAKIGGTPIPYVYAVVIGREVEGDEARTAGKKLRRDVVAVKHTWRLQTRPMTKAEAQAVISGLESAMFAAETFELEDEDSVMAYVDIDEEEIVQFGRDGVWHNDGRQLTLTVREQ